MDARDLRTGLAALGTALLCGLPGCSRPQPPDDIADGRKAEDFPELAVDVFKDMDRARPKERLELTADEIKGRNTWNLWCGGNEQFWDRMARESYGLIDLLKTIDSRRRGQRFKEIGLINQPGMRAASQPDRHGLWIDESVEPEPAGIDPKVFGRPTGVLGFRLFDNPDFTADAARRWEESKARFYTDEQLAADPKLVRPYRVGVACGSCHIAFNPVHPPADPENPQWENLASAIGNQYIREGFTFAPLVKKGGFFWEMIMAQPPGTSDTSRIATDHINNPNMINPIFDLGARLAVATGHSEQLVGETLELPGATAKADVPRVLKDGADSVGVIGATLRVYINIGMYSQHWLQQHNALIGLKDQEPFSIKAAKEHSVYWNATAQKVPNVATFFKRLRSFRLADAPGGTEYLKAEPAVMDRGKVVFAENCASCHSSKRPPAGADPKAWFRQEVMKADFLTDNFLSDESRHSVSDIGTNVSRAAGTNARDRHVWHNFSSKTYKDQAAIAPIKVWNPYTDQDEDLALPAGGPGYYRTPSLLCLWSSAPFLHNNALGKFTGDPSVKGRMDAFEDAVEKLLWPEKRPGRASIWRTSAECQLQINSAVIPDVLRKLLAAAKLIDEDGYFRLGHIPKGTPINLLANVDPEARHTDLVALLVKLKKTLAEIHVAGLTGAAADARLKEEIGPALWKVNKCRDFVEDRGHVFGSGLPDADKRALIELLKTF